MITPEKPCPRHPENGNVPWIELISPRFPGDKNPRTEEIPICLPCTKEMKPVGRQEFAS